MTLLTERCNPYGFGTDSGPKHLMGGIFGPEYAGKDLVLADGVSGIGICPNRVDAVYVMKCPVGHTGPRMPLCYPHRVMIQKRMAATCTRCVMPPESRELWERQQHYADLLVRATRARDEREANRLRAILEDIGNQQVELTLRGLTPKRPLRLEEVS